MQSEIFLYFVSYISKGFWDDFQNNEIWVPEHLKAKVVQNVLSEFQMPFKNKIF